MNDIKIQIQNYKLIKDYDQIHKNVRILLVTGKNEIGKSSLIRALIENITAKSQTDDPVTHGELSGSKTFTVPDKNGNTVTIIHEFSNTNKKGTFYCIDHEGRKIKEVNRIREIIGIFEEISIDTFYTLQQTSAGRRKIIENYLYPLLSPTQKSEIESIDNRTTKGGELYDKRTAVNQNINYYSTLVDNSRPAKEDELLAQEHENLMSEIINLEEEKLKQSEKAIRKQHVWEKINELEKAADDFVFRYKTVSDDTTSLVNAKLADIKEYEEKIRLANESIENARVSLKTKTEAIRQEEVVVHESLKNFKNVYDEIPVVVNYEEKLTELRLFRDQALQANNKIAKYNDARGELKKAQSDLTELEKEILSLKERKKDILDKSNLPSGLSIDGDEFTWKGFNFSDTQISKSSALLVIAEILCNIVESKIVYLGEKALFDKDRFKQLVTIAEKYGKIPVLEQVIDEQTEIKVITEVEDL